MSHPSTSAPTRVLAILVGGAARTGGPPAFVGGSARELDRLGGSMRILATDLALAPTGVLQTQRRIQRSELHPTLIESDLELFRAKFPRRFAYSPELAKAAHELAPSYDVVHLHNLWQFPQFAGYRAALKAQIPYIVSPHGGLDPYLREHGRRRKALMNATWQRNMLDRAAMIHVTTEAEEDLISDIAPHVPRAIVAPGVYVSEFNDLPPGEPFRHTHLAGYEGPVILFLGRITYKKGVDLLVRAFARTRQAAECRLAIVGPDDEGLQAGLQTLARSLGVEQEIVFTGALYGADRLAALASADVWALSSHTENFGIAVIEAMAAGVPTVISPEVNLSADIAAADAGVVAALEPEVFGEAMGLLISDPARRERLRIEGRRFAARYDWSTLAPALSDMYRTAAASR